MPSTQIKVLLAEDSEDDVVLLREASDQVEEVRLVGTVRDGAELFRYLETKGLEGLEGRPDLILLDLNLPRRSGFEILADLKGDLRFRDIAVRILTTSAREDDLARALSLGAQAYSVKPFGFLGTVNLLRELFHTKQRHLGER